MQDNKLLARTTIDYPGKPALIVLDAHREALLVRDLNKHGQVWMLRKRDAGKWAAHTLLDDPHIDIQSMCVLDGNKISIFDDKSAALRIYE